MKRPEFPTPPGPDDSAIPAKFDRGSTSLMARILQPRRPRPGGSSAPRLFMAWFVGAWALFQPELARAIDATVNVTLSTSIRDLQLTPIDFSGHDGQLATGNPAVGKPTTLSRIDAYGLGTATADASGQAGLLRCRTTCTYPYVVPSRTEGGGSSSEATIEVFDYITVSSPTLPAGTVIGIAVTMSFQATVSPPFALQTRPGINAQFLAFVRATSSVDDQIDRLSYPIQMLRDLTFNVNAKVGETFQLRYELDASTYLVSGIPDVRSVVSDVYSTDHMAVVTLSPLDPGQVVLTPVSGAPYNGKAPPTSPPATLPPWVSESPAELAAGLDADGDGREDFLVVDKESGVRRLGLQQADGSFVWAEPKSTGLDGVTGLGIGQFAEKSTAEGFAVASPLGNRVHVFNEAAGEPVVAPSVGIGPSLVVGFNFAGDARDDLAIGTEWDKGPDPVHLSGLASGTGALGAIYGPHLETGVLKRGNRARFAPDRPWMLGALRETNGGREFVTRPIFGFPGFTDGPTLGGLAPDAEWAWGQFQTNDLARFVFYSPGRSSLYVPGLVEPTAFQYVWTAGDTFDLGRPIARVLVVPMRDGAMLMVVFGDEGSATIYDFDGVHAPVARQAIAPPSGNGFSIGGALGNGDFITLVSAAGGAGASTDWQRWGFDGTKHRVVSNGALPALGVSQARANVLLFGSDSDLDAAAPLIRSLQVGEWSDRAVPVGSNLQVTREQYLGPTLGLGAPGTTDVSVSALGLFPAANRRSPIYSVAVFAPPIPSAVADVTFSPAPGTYHLDAGNPLLIQLNSATGGAIQYRTNHAGIWTLYAAGNPPRIAASTRIEAFVDLVSPGPIRSASYVIAAAPGIVVGPKIDADGNGLPDAWEAAFGVSNPQGDPDGDGFTNRQEYLAGTDPLDAASKPGNALGTVSLISRLPGPAAPIGTVCEIAWPATVTGASLESTDDLGVPGSWVAISDPLATVGVEQVYYEPETGGHETRYYRLRANP